MAVNIGPKIGIEGESEYRKQINNIITQAKTLSSEMKVVESSFSAEATAQEKAAAKAQVLNKQVENQKKLVAENSRMLQESAEKYGENDARTMRWQQAVNNATAELNKMEAELEETQKTADGYGSEVEDATDKQDKFVDSAIKMKALEQAAEFLQKASDKFKEFADSAVNAAKELDEGYDTIVTKTGATGDALEDLKGTADNIFGSMPAEMADVGAAVGEVNTRFKLTGDQLQATSEDFLKFSQINNTDVSNSIDSVDRLISIFGEDAGNTSNILGLLTKASQDTGIATDKLMSSLDSNGATLNELGLNLETSVSLMAQFEKNGVDTSGVMAALKKSITNAAASGKDANTMLKDTAKRIVNAKDNTEALQIATEVFGARGAVVMADGLRSGRISIEELSGSLDKYGKVVGDTYEATLDPWDKTQVAMNNLKRAGGELAANALSQLTPAIEGLTRIVKGAVEGFNKLPDGTKKAIGVFTALAGAALIAGPKILGVVKAIEGFKIAQSLSAGVSALTAAQTANAAAAGGATVAQNGLNAAMLANPAMLVVAGVAALTAALVVFAKKNLEATKEQRESIKAMDEVSQSTREMRANMEESAATTEAEGARIDKLVSRLKELQSKTQLTASEQAEMRRTVAQLNDAMPGLNATIDTQTGKLAGNTSEIMTNIDAWQKSYETQLKQKQLEQILDQLATANNDLAKAEQEVNKYAEQGAGSKQGQAEAAKNLTSMINGNAIAVGKDAQAAMANEAAYAKANATKTEVQGTISALEAQYDEIVNSIDAESAAMVENGQTEEGLIAQNNALEGSEAELANSIYEGATTMQEAYVGVAQSAYDSVMQQSNLFQKLESDSTISLQSMNEALVSQAEAYNNYAANTNAVLNDQRYQTDASFRAMADSILNMGMEGRDYLQQFVNAAQGSGDELSMLLANYGNVDQAVQAYANATAGFQTATTTAVNGVDSVLAGAQANFQSQAQQLGAQVPQGTSQGIANNAGTVNTAVTNMISSGQGGEIAAETVGTAMGRALARGIIQTSGQVKGNVESVMAGARNSVTSGGNAAQTQARTAGQNIGIGLATGLTSQQGAIRSAMANITSAMRTAINGISQLKGAATQAGVGIGAGITSGMNSQKGSVTSAATALGNEAKKAVTQVEGYGTSAYNAGANIGSQMASGMEAKNGSVSTASSNLGTAAKGSLSTVGDSAYSWGSHLGNNFAAGIRDSRQAAVSQAQATADAVARILKHSTPKEGPLKDDDVWGLHLAENFAEGIALGAGDVKRASEKLGSAAEQGIAVEVPVFDPDVVSGRGSYTSTLQHVIAGGIDAAAIYNAVREGAAAANTSVVIGEREFMRILRDVGVA